MRYKYPRGRDAIKWMAQAARASDEREIPFLLSAAELRYRSLHIPPGAILWCGPRPHPDGSFIPPDEIREHVTPRSRNRITRNDIDNIAAGWRGVRLFLKKDIHPHPEDLAILVRHSPIPKDLRNYVAEVLAGKVPRRRGPRAPRVGHPNNDSRFSSFQLRPVTAYRVVRWQRVFDRARRRTGRSSDPYREALAKVSEETGIPESTLDKWCYPRSR